MRSVTIRVVGSSAVVLVLLVAACGRSAGAAPVPEARFVGVDAGVRLEVLDWGGTGRPVVLLAGSGHTAHIFDEFAPTLRDCCHVYAVTRRGYGASSRPDTGYDDQRLADDVRRRWRDGSRRAEEARLHSHLGAGAGDLHLHHHIFLSHQADVVREVHAFVAGLR